MELFQLTQRGIQRHALLEYYFITRFCDFFKLWRRQLASKINPLNAGLNPICHFLALLGAHHILHVSRVRVKQVLITLAPLTGLRSVMK
jgi:hypothetical protein